MMDPGQCPRCGGDLHCHSVSYFNTEVICCDCKTEERQLPGFAAAQAAEEAAVAGGNPHFPGVGLTSTDREVMAQLIAARHGTIGGKTDSRSIWR